MDLPLGRVDGIGSQVGGEQPLCAGWVQGVGARVGISVGPRLVSKETPPSAPSTTPGSGCVADRPGFPGSGARSGSTGGDWQQQLEEAAIAGAAGK